MILIWVAVYNTQNFENVFNSVPGFPPTSLYSSMYMAGRHPKTIHETK